jgi:hypothetical protein
MKLNTFIFSSLTLFILILANDDLILFSATKIINTKKNEGVIETFIFRHGLNTMGDIYVNSPNSKVIRATYRNNKDGFFGIRLETDKGKVLLRVDKFGYQLIKLFLERHPILNQRFREYPLLIPEISDMVGFKEGRNWEYLVSEVKSEIIYYSPYPPYSDENRVTDIQIIDFYNPVTFQVGDRVFIVMDPDSIVALIYFFQRSNDAVITRNFLNNVDLNTKKRKRDLD